MNKVGLRDPPDAVSGTRFNNLTVARFVAALLVYFHHRLPIEKPDMGAGVIYNVLSNGYDGVTFFFVLSGFVLASANLKKMEIFSIRGTLSFYWKRIARIVPLWLVVSAPYIWHAYQLGDPKLITYLTFTQAWSSNLDVVYGVYAVSWTLSVEMFFYAVFPIISAILRPFQGRWIGPFLMAFGLTFSSIGAIYFAMRPGLVELSWYDPASPHRWLYLFPAVRLGDFIMGIGAFITVNRGTIKWARSSSAMILSGSIIGLLVTMATLPMVEVSPEFPMIKTSWWTFPDVAFFAIIVLSLAQLEITGASVKSKSLILLGEASFAFYLIHYDYMKKLLLPPLASALGIHLAQSVTLLLTISISIALYLSVERPCRKFLLHIAHMRSNSCAHELPKSTQVNQGAGNNR